MTDPRTALEEAFRVIYPRVHGKGYEQWETTATRFRRFLDAEAWESAAITLVPRGWEMVIYRQFDDDGDYWAKVMLRDSFTGQRGDYDDPVDVSATSGVRIPYEDPTFRAIIAACLKAKEAGDGR